MGTPSDGAYDADAAEQAVLRFWKDNRIFERSVEQRSDATPFLFLEGPPTANGMPHAGHVLTRTLKDSVLRYQTMRGHRVERRAGWDCHGLPVEIEVEKELGLKNKQEIEQYGVAEFNAKCRQSVFRYRDEWVRMSERVGFWLDFDKAYVTLDDEYIESVWWSLRQAWGRDLLYQGHRVSPYCPRCGTALSSHEVAQGYRDVEEPSVFVKFRRAGTNNEFFLAWTTTPWTLPGNVGLAVGKDIEYVTVEQAAAEGPARYTLARSCLSVLRGEYQEVSSAVGGDLVDVEYEPVFPWLAQQLAQQNESGAFRIHEADFVTTEDGTGIVHTAAMYGEDDYDLAVARNIPRRHTVDLDGCFEAFVKDYAGRPVKQADSDIIEDMRASGALYRVKAYTHTYPFCWRCSTPLLYYALDSWFLRMTSLRDRLVEHNSGVNWLPPHIKDGRFGEFIGNVRDWALSRDRYWGTPLPVWTCGECQHRECIGSIADLLEHAGPDAVKARSEGTLDLHKPGIDALQWPCTKCAGTMVRETSVIDTWYDSGSAHFAAWHYPFENKEAIERVTPVDFIAEGIDQTRGWFYSLLATSTLAFDQPAYRNVVVNGLVLDDEGQKMSKSKRNYTDPDQVFRVYGADAVRWTLLSANSPWADKRFGEAAVRENYTRFVLTLWNTFSFFETYRALDEWVPGQRPAHLEALDRWLISRVASTAAVARDAADGYQLHKAVRAAESLLVDDVSNWWLRRSRRRFWSGADSADKQAAYWTLHHALTMLTRLVAPFAPFLADHVHGVIRHPDSPPSVHLCDYPDPAAEETDPAIEAAMTHVRALAEGARAMRAKAGVKNRIPLGSATLVARGDAHDALDELLPILQAEANVKQVKRASSSAGFETTSAKVNQRSVGRAMKGAAKPVLNALRDMDGLELARALDAGGAVTVETPEGALEVAADHFDIETVEKEGTVKAESGTWVLYLDTTLTPELEAEGWAREVVRRVQQMRKEAGCAMEEPVKTIVEAEASIQAFLAGWVDEVKAETRSTQLTLGPVDGTAIAKEWNVDGHVVRISIERKPA